MWPSSRLPHGALLTVVKADVTRPTRDEARVRYTLISSNPAGSCSPTRGRRIDRAAPRTTVMAMPTWGLDDVRTRLRIAKPSLASDRPTDDYSSGHRTCPDAQRDHRRDDRVLHGRASRGAPAIARALGHRARAGPFASTHPLCFDCCHSPSIRDPRSASGARQDPDRALRSFRSARPISLAPDACATWLAASTLCDPV